MAQGQDKKGMFSGYLKFERPLSCEIDRYTHTEGFDWECFAEMKPLLKVPKNSGWNKGMMKRRLLERED